MCRLAPHLAAIEGALPCRVAEGQRIWRDPVRICIGTQEVSDDLDGLSEDIRKKGGFGASIVDGPGSTCACGQTNIALRTHCVAQQKCRVPRRWRNGSRSGWVPDILLFVLSLFLSGGDAGDGQSCQSCHRSTNDGLNGSPTPASLTAIVGHFLFPSIST